VDRDRIVTPFGAKSTAAEVIAGIDLRDKRAIVTGSSSGIGLESARACQCKRRGREEGRVSRGVQLPDHDG
jgi:hypothetical protein